jgi:hypothetical protein
MWLFVLSLFFFFFFFMTHHTCIVTIKLGKTAEEMGMGGGDSTRPLLVSSEHGNVDRKDSDNDMRDWRSVSGGGSEI